MKSIDVIAKDRNAQHVRGRLCYISASVIPSTTANSIHVMRMADALVQCGWQVTLLGRSPGQPLDFNRIHSHYGTSPAFEIELLGWPSMRLIGSMWFAYQTIGWLRENAGTVDVVYGRHVPSLYLAARLGMRSTLEVHAPPETALHREVIRHLIVAPGFQRIVAISHALREHYLSQFPKLQPSRIIVAHDGAQDLLRDTREAPPVVAFKPGFAVGYAGQLYPGKGLEVLAEIAPRMPDVQFQVIGGNQPDLYRWRARIPALNVHFHGLQTPATVGRWIRACDVVIAPYQHRVESAGGGGDIARWMSPLKIFEYMSAGKAMVVSDLPVIREVLRHSVNSMLVAPDDPDGWIAAIATLRDDPSLRRRLGDAARKEFMARYTWRARAEAVLA